MKSSKTLDKTHPLIAAQWHPTKNGRLKPCDVLSGCGKRVWWKCPLGDDHEWEATVNKRTCGTVSGARKLASRSRAKPRGCPFCAGRRVSLASNLATLYPEVASQWHPSRNGTLKPSQCKPASSRKVWWQCPAVPHHQWAAKVCHRTKSGSGCPFCAGRRLDGRRSLANCDPGLASEWHPNRNGSLSPSSVTPFSNRKVWWQCRRVASHVWQTAVAHRSAGTGCPFCSGQRAGVDNSLAATRPALAAEWHTSRNGPLTAADVVPGSNRRVWWQCPRGAEHQWQATVASRVKGRGCPFCRGARVSATNSLAMVRPDLASQWHATKNGTLRPEHCVPRGDRKVWWTCARDSTHEWRASIASRVGGSGCPTCARMQLGARRATVTGENHLAACFPNVAAMWHPTKNAALPKTSPAEYRPRSNVKVWWKCPRGRDHEWEASIADLVGRKGRGCPFCSGRRPTADRNFEVTAPQLAAEWHPTRNGDKQPCDYTPRSGAKVWWRCRRVATHEWQATIDARVGRGSGCPYCTSHKPSAENALTVVFPQVAAQWHPTRNGNHRPEEFTKASSYRAWWLCPKGHSWQASIGDRTSGGNCPRCSPHTSAPEIRVLAEATWLFGDVHPRHKVDGIEVDVFLPSLGVGIEFDGSYWHKSKEDKDRKKHAALASKGITLLRIREFPLRPLTDLDVVTARTGILDKQDFNRVVSKLQAFVDSETVRRLEQYISLPDFQNDGLFRQYLSYLPNPLPTFSLEGRYPQLIRQYDYERNHPLVPANIPARSSLQLWWKCDKGEDHRWQASASNRAQGTGCPFCAGKKLSRSNSLAATHPSVACEWHPTKNGDLSPEDLVAGSNRRVWWRCSKCAHHEWHTKVTNRTSLGRGCPYCCGRRTMASTSLAAVLPTLAAEWHPTKNGTLGPKSVRPKSNKRVWWKCKKNGAHEWQAVIGSRTAGNGCPFCRGLRVGKDNSLATICPRIAAEWHPTKNGSRTPQSVTRNSGLKVWWQCPLEADHVWLAPVYSRTDSSGCPFCLGRRAANSNNLATVRPDLAAQWHSTKNGSKRPEQFVTGSSEVVWWQCDKGVSHEWRAKIVARSRGGRCPFCTRRKIGHDNNLAVARPDVAATWHAKKNKKLSPTDVAPGYSGKVWWQCPLDRSHQWQATVASRCSGCGCPFCAKTTRTLKARTPKPGRSLKDLEPDLAKQWHPTRNGLLTPSDVKPGSGMKAWWRCLAGEGHEWEAVIGSRVRGNGCPFCAGRKVCSDNSLATRFPAVSREWHPKKNGRLTPGEVAGMSNRVVWWKCREAGHKWQAPVCRRTLGGGCPACGRRKQKRPRRKSPKRRH